ncbi:hypothetical protein ACFE04_030106 [Oxalis oulophora]
MNSKVEESIERERVVFMWGYLPGAVAQRSPILTPVVVRMIQDKWKDVCGGGCGFAIAMSEPFPLPPEVVIVKSAAGWAHCVAVTDSGEIYTWGWKECIPSGKVFGDPSRGGSSEKEVFDRQSSLMIEQVSPRSQGSRPSSSTLPSGDSKAGGEENVKRRRLSSAKQQAAEGSSPDETLSAFPCLVTLNPGVRISTVAAGGRHTLALSGNFISWMMLQLVLIPSYLFNVVVALDAGQVWGWGYGGEGQLGLGSRIRMVSSPHLVPCIDTSFGKDRSPVLSRGSMSRERQGFRVPGSYVKAIACGGRHSAVITDAGALLTFGWGLYGQHKSVTENIRLLELCGQGSTDDELKPTCVSGLLGIQIESVAAGLWHTLCVSADGDVYAFGGNQFGQLGTGGDQAETLPRLIDAPSLEDVNAKVVSCGARHSAIITEDGKVFCWGWNKYGQLGLGDVIDRNIPSQVPVEGCVPKNVACGWWHTLLLGESPPT